MGQLLRLPIAHPPPKTRGDCAPGAPHAVRPCPWSRCTWHRDRVHDGPGRRLERDDAEPVATESTPETCVLDVADGGGATLEDVGQFLGVSRERIRQIEDKVLNRLQRLSGFVGAGGDVARGLLSYANAPSPAHRERPQGSGREVLPPPPPVDPDEADDEGNDSRYVPRLPHILDASITDQQYADAIGRLWADHARAREAVARGALIQVHGHYISQLHATVLRALGDYWRDHGRAPSALELADASGVGADSTSQDARRVAVGTAVATLRECGLVVGVRSELRVATGAEVEAAAAARPALPAPRPTPALPPRRVTPPVVAAKREQGNMAISNESSLAERCSSAQQLLRTNGPMAVREVCEALSLDEAVARNTLNALKRAGAAEVVGLARNARWQLTTQGARASSKAPPAHAPAARRRRRPRRARPPSGCRRRPRRRPRSRRRRPWCRCTTGRSCWRRPTTSRPRCASCAASSTGCAPRRRTWRARSAS